MFCFSIFPALFHCFSHALGVLLAVIFVQVRCFDVGWRASVWVVEQTNVYGQLRGLQEPSSGLDVGWGGCLPLNTRQDGRNVVCRTPPVLQNVQTQLSGCVDVGVKHLADELDSRGFVRILLLKMHHQSKGSIFKGSVGWTYYDGIPVAPISWISLWGSGRGKISRIMSFQDGDIPCHDIIGNGGCGNTGGRVGLHALKSSISFKPNFGRRRPSRNRGGDIGTGAYLEVTHQASASCGGHVECCLYP